MLLQLSTEERWDGSNVQSNACPEENTGKLLCPICGDVELILESTSFCLPCGILATGWNTVQSICFSSDAVIASLLCLRDAKVSHPLYLILSDWMSGNGRRRSCTRYHFLPYYNILLHTAESCRISSEAHVCIHFIMLLPALPHQHGIKSAGTCSTSSQNCRKVNQFEMNKINSWEVL